MEKCNLSEHKRIREKLVDSENYVQGVNEICKIFSLLGDVSRVKILLALMEGELCVYHICEITGAKQSATSQHLRKLKDCKLVKSRKDGNLVLYSIADEHVASIVKTALEHKDCE